MNQEEHLLSLRPKFKFGDITMIDWFEKTEGEVFYCIRSGLRHADGETKSPYHYEKCVTGLDAKQRALNEFFTWFNDLKIEME